MAEAARSEANPRKSDGPSGGNRKKLATKAESAGGAKTSTKEPESKLLESPREVDAAVVPGADVSPDSPQEAKNARLETPVTALEDVRTLPSPPVIEAAQAAAEAVRSGVANSAGGVPTVYTPHTMSDVPDADVVVALGVRPEGAYTPSKGMMSNLLTAVALYKAGRAKYLMVCGGYTRGHIAEAEMMAIVAQGLGVKWEDLVLENGSVDTEENARNAAMLASQRGFRRAILVAQKDHMERAAGLFVAASGFPVLFSVVGQPMEPDFPASPVARPQVEGKPDAIVVHGVSTGADFSAPALAVDASLVQLLSAAAGLYAQYSVPVVLWHPIHPHGHISRTEVMAILLASMGVPEKRLVLGSARRYQQAGLSIEKLCKSVKAKRVVAVMGQDGAYDSVRMLGRNKPRDLGGPGSAVQAEDLYHKAGIQATPAFVELQY